MNRLRETHPTTPMENDETDDKRGQSEISRRLHGSKIEMELQKDIK